MKVKLIVHVPLEAEEAVRNALGRSGAGVIGEYSYCSFTTRGIGRFKPSNNANPHIGKTGEVTEVEEVCIEVICERDHAKAVIEAVKKVHPYEEPGIEIIPVIDTSEL